MGFLSFIPQWKGDYTKCTDISTLEPGDQIAIWDYGKYFRYQHHGLIWKAGTTAETIQVCHIWSPFEDRQQSQADSHFRISTLADFLYKRPLKGMRVVEYHTSSSRRCFAELGEVHPYPSDCPEIVLARAQFLMGLGKGEFDIFSQNCEHSAHWCKTGIQYCSQNAIMAPGSIPFKKEMSVTQEQALYVQIAAIEDSIGLEMKRIVSFSEEKKLVYIRVKGTKDQYLQVSSDDNKTLKIVNTSGSAATPFQIQATQDRYDRVQIRFDASDTHDKSLRSHGHWTGNRDIQLVPNKGRKRKAITWNYRSTGHIVSQQQHRRYWSVNKKSGILEEASLRGKATKFELVWVEDTDVVVPDLPPLRDPQTTVQPIVYQQSASVMPKIQEEEEGDFTCSGTLQEEQPKL